MDTKALISAAANAARDMDAVAARNNMIREAHKEGMSAYRLAQITGLSQARIGKIVGGSRVRVTGKGEADFLGDDGRVHARLLRRMVPVSQTVILSEEGDIGDSAPRSVEDVTEKPMWVAVAPQHEFVPNAPIIGQARTRAELVKQLTD